MKLPRKKVRVNLIAIDECIGNLEPRMEFESASLDRVQGVYYGRQYEGVKRKVIEDLLDGYNFHEIAIKMKVPNSQMYKIKGELEKDFAFLLDEESRRSYIDKNSAELELLLSTVKEQIRGLTLSQFVSLHINDYDQEAQIKKWQEIPLQDTYEKIWNENAKSCILAPREHLKTTSVLEYIIKIISAREYPLEIDYFHLNGGIAMEKLQKLQRMVELNPMLAHNFQLEQARNWFDGGARLKDGTTIRSGGYGQGVVGKHPHIIILDDVIDRTVIYSDQQNQKAIDKFYSDIYPMISKSEPNKKIIIIGTAQRNDDLYSKLPADFKKVIFQAVVNEEKQQVLEPALFSWAELMKIKSDISEIHGEKYWLKEYQNVPFSSMGLIIRSEWVKRYTEAPQKLKIYQGWDLSVGKDIESGDWTAGVTIGIDEIEGMLYIYILDVFRARIGFAERLKAIVASANTWKPIKIAVENNVFQYDTVSTLQKQTNLPIVGIQTVRNKVESFQVELAPHFENGKVYVRADMQALIDELLTLPVGKHDDMSDALKLAIRVSSIKTAEPRIRILG